MLSYIDCVALCGLTEEEIAAIAEHEHIPAIVAVELGSYLIHTPDGVPMLKRMILDDIQAARSRAKVLKSVWPTSRGETVPSKSRRRARAARATAGAPGSPSPSDGPTCNRSRWALAWEGSTGCPSP